MELIYHISLWGWTNCTWRTFFEAELGFQLHNLRALSGSENISIYCGISSWWRFTQGPCVMLATSMTYWCTFWLESKRKHHSPLPYFANWHKTKISSTYLTLEFDNKYTYCQSTLFCNLTQNQNIVNLPYFALSSCRDKQHSQCSQGPSNLKARNNGSENYMIWFQGPAIRRPEITGLKIIWFYVITGHDWKMA